MKFFFAVPYNSEDGAIFRIVLVVRRRLNSSAFTVRVFFRIAGLAHDAVASYHQRSKRGPRSAPIRAHSRRGTPNQIATNASDPPG